MSKAHHQGEQREGQAMRIESLRYAFAAILIVALSGSGYAGDARTSNGALQSKIEYCSYCHGSSGQGYKAFYAMPRLAGQTPEYFENQLRAYAERRRKNAIMYNVAHALSPQMRAALARHFSSLHPGPYGHGVREQIATGRKIFEEGLPNENVPACAACHGLDAHGYEVNPRLAGQLDSYIQKALMNWSKERGHSAGDSNPASVMQPVAQNLNKSQAAAVAAYLSSLK